MKAMAVLILLGSLSLAAQTPTTRPVVIDKQIAGLIGQLDSPDAALREKATAKLINLGPRVLKPLRDALAGETTPEFSGRARQIIEEISRQWKYVNEIGGEAAGGVMDSLVRLTQTGLVHSTIMVDLSIPGLWV